MFVEETLGFSKCHRVLDTRLVNFLQQTAMQLNDPNLKRYPSFRFPGGLPITVESRHVKTITAGNYMFSAKADGVRVLVVFCIYYLDGDWQKLSAMISRDGSCHLLNLEVPSDINDNGGSLFDAELVETTSGWNHILLFDCYSYRGSNVRQLPLQRRFARCEKLAQQSNHREYDSVILKAKPYFKLIKKNLDDAIAFLNNKNHFMEYHTDGIILVPPGRADCVTGRDESQFKLKLDHTLDLILTQDTDDDDKPFYLASYDESDDSYIVKQQLDLSTFEFNGEFEINTIFECKVVTIDEIHTFVPIKPRPDKTSPNSETVIKRTLQTITDDIKVVNLMLA